jgi:hypothetical protein
MIQIQCLCFRSSDIPQTSHHLPRQDKRVNRGPGHQQAVFVTVAPLVAPLGCSVGTVQGQARLLYVTDLSLTVEA